MTRDRLNFLFLNVGHFLDHLFMLVFATVAALRLTEEWGMSYAALIPYATPGLRRTLRGDGRRRGRDLRGGDAAAAHRRDRRPPFRRLNTSHRSGT